MFILVLKTDLICCSYAAHSLHRKNIYFFIITLFLCSICVFLWINLFSLKNDFEFLLTVDLDRWLRIAPMPTNRPSRDQQRKTAADKKNMNQISWFNFNDYILVCRSLLWLECECGSRSINCVCLCVFFALLVLLLMLIYARCSEFIHSNYLLLNYHRTDSANFIFAHAFAHSKYLSLFILSIVDSNPFCSRRQFIFTFGNRNRPIEIIHKVFFFFWINARQLFIDEKHVRWIFFLFHLMNGLSLGSLECDLGTPVLLRYRLVFDRVHRFGVRSHTLGSFSWNEKLVEND